MSADPSGRRPAPEAADAAALAPSDRTTLVEVLAAYAEDGYDAQLSITDEGRVRCHPCGEELDPAALHVQSLRRMEGASDPADMLAVLAVVCPTCGARGTLVVHYGPEASAAEAAVLLAVEDDRGRSPLAAGRAPGETHQAGPEEPT